MGMIRVAQRQPSGLFLRLTWDPGISLLDNLVANIEVAASVYFHEIGSLVGQSFERLSELLQHPDALLIDCIEEYSYVSILLDQVSSGGCFTSFRLVWDLGIISSFCPVRSME